MTPPEVWESFTPEIVGEIGFATTVCVATAEIAVGVLTLAVSVMVPAMVPVLKVTFGAPEKLALVELAEW